MAKILKRRFLLVFSKNLSLNDGKSREQHARGKKNILKMKLMQIGEVERQRRKYG